MTVDLPIADPPSRTLMDYAEHLANLGTHVVPGTPGTFWSVYEVGTIMRRPTFCLEAPGRAEVRRVLLQGRAAIASYLQKPDEHHAANSWLYLCRDAQYSLDRLSPVMRRNVRRGLQELRVAWLTPDQLLASGLTAFCDNRRRNGLNDGTPEVFYRRFRAFAQIPEHRFLGAWKDGRLAAFLTIVEVEDWAEIGCFSMNDLLHYRPNETLIYSALHHYLVKRSYSLVSYGLSSVQPDSNAAGLHRFKIKDGFEAVPVHRIFIPHPVMRPFVNSLTCWSIERLLRLRPADRHLKKASGMLALMLGHAPGPHTVAGPANDA